MIGTGTPWLARHSTIRGTAAAASSWLTVTRTSSLPARANSATWRAVAATSAVSVLVIDWTTTGWEEPTATASMGVVTVRRREETAMGMNLKRSGSDGPDAEGSE